MYTDFEKFINNIRLDNIAYSEAIKNMDLSVYDVVNNYVGQYTNSFDSVKKELSENDIQLFIRCRKHGFITIEELEELFDIEIQNQPFESAVQNFLEGDESIDTFYVDSYLD